MDQKIERNDYYNDIKNILIDNEVTKKVKEYSINRNELDSYYKVGELLSKADKNYGKGIMKEYSEKLKIEVGKKYSVSYLRKMRQFYMLIQKGAPLVSVLSYSHYLQLLPLENINAINYYIDQVKQYNLSKNKLIEKIKNNEYERLDDNTKKKLITKEHEEITDYIKHPIIIKVNTAPEETNEKFLKKAILENLDNFLKELGPGYCYIENEYKIKIGKKNNYVDLLLYNIKYNSYVVVELKATELKKDHIGQVQVYMNYIDKHIKGIYQNKTIGIIICKKDNNLILEYSSDPRIFSTTYLIIKK